MNVNELFRNAENAYQAGQYEQALNQLNSILSSTGAHPVVLHLSGLCQKNLGQTDEAIDTLLQATALAPQDPQIANNMGNCLLQAERFTEALQQYDKAITLQENFDDARLNRAICFHRLERFDDARKDFDWLQRKNPNIARLWSARGAMELDSGEYVDAEAAYNKALAIKSTHPKAMAGLAKTALELGRRNTVELFEKARTANPDDPQIAMDHAYARQAAGDPDAADSLRPTVEANPDWVEGQKGLASIIWESGASDNYTALFEKVVSEQPENDLLRDALCITYEGSDDIQNAYETALARPNDLPENQTFALKKADYASQLGLQSEADGFFSSLPDEQMDIRLLKAKHALRYEKTEEAEELLFTLREEYPDNIAVWAISDLGWRLTGDDRHNWLHGQPGLFGPGQLELGQKELEEIADYLRHAHGSNAQPLNQSLRGGTQTRGLLLKRPDALVQKLKKAIESAVLSHWNNLPELDEQHPLLRHRDREPAIKGSWSVRLVSKGFHVQHIHPEGLLSSACYLVLPDKSNADDPYEGWLELGRAAPDLPWNIDPLERIEPQVGRIALFPSTLFHGTRPFDAGERVTVAFDIVCQDQSIGNQDQ